MIARTARSAGSISRLASPSVLALVLRIPAGWRDFDIPVRLDIRSMRLHVVERGTIGQTLSVRLSIQGTKDHVFWFRGPDHAAEHCVEFRFMGDERFAPQTEAARFAQQHQPKSLDVNDQRQLPEIGFRFAAWAFREFCVGVGIQDERVSGVARRPVDPSVLAFVSCSGLKRLANGCASPAALRVPGAVWCNARLASRSLRPSSNGAGHPPGPPPRQSVQRLEHEVRLDSRETQRSNCETSPGTSRRPETGVALQRH
jgi:hypothetical protein